MRTHTTRFFSLVLALVMCLTLAPAAGAAEGFSDVGTSAWYYNDVMECAGLGVVTGYEDGRFDPEGMVTDVQFIVMLTRTFYNDAVEAAKATATGSWYAANAKVAADVGMSIGLTLNDTAMNRYDMALALYNVILNKDKKSSATSAQLTDAQNSIKDWDQIQAMYTNAVKYNYAFGIITGMDGGYFYGDQTMTRAQACTVIVRMIKLINNGETPAQPETPTQPQQPETPQQTPGKLANGKDITVDNVLEIIEEIKREYPEGTVWGAQGTPGNHWYSGISGAGTDMYNLTKNYKSQSSNGTVTTSLQYGCGGYACMVTERIFGKTGFPFREVYRTEDCRPGDIIITINDKGWLTHVGVVMSMPISGVNAGGYAYCTFDRMDGNLIGSDGIGRITWQYGDGVGGNTHVFTRYPEGVAE